MTKKLRLVSALAILIGIALTGIGAVLTLNYTGFCVSEFRYVPDAEKIRRVVSGLIRGGVTRGFADKDGQLVEIGSVTTLPYANVEEFFAVNEDCCQMGPVVGEGYYPPTFARRLAGVLSDIVSVRYLKRTQDEAGIVTAEEVLEQFSVGPCGRVVSNVLF